MNMGLNKKRKSENGSGKESSSVPTKRPKDEGGKKNWNSKKTKPESLKKGTDDKKFKPKQAGEPGQNKKKGVKRNSVDKKRFSAIVTEAKANYQLYTDKKCEAKEKELLLNATIKLVKDHIPELNRMKGMGKIISSLMDRKNRALINHVLECYSSTEAKLLLMKGNGYKVAVQLIKTGTSKTVHQFVDACISNGKGVRGLMSNFKSARVVNAAYVYGNTEAKRKLLTRLALGSMPIAKDDEPLDEVFSKCKGDVVEGCKTFLQSILDEKSIKYEVVQDLLALCIKTHKATEMDVEEFITLASEHTLVCCSRSTHSSLLMWTVWLATAQKRKAIMKSLKGKIVSILQSYNGRMFLMALFESTDDTKALSKMVLKEFLEPLDDLVKNTEARKLLEFLLFPRSTKFFHPMEIEILRQGDSVRTSKKSDDARFDEIREYVREPIMTAFGKNYEQWLQDNKLCLFTIAIIERYGTSMDTEILRKIATCMAAPEFSDRIVQKASRMVLESLINADIVRHEADPEASSFFLSEFVQVLEEPQITNLVNNCIRQVTHIYDNAMKLKGVLPFKPKKTWLHDKKVVSKINEWKSRSQSEDGEKNSPKEKKKVKKAKK